jgi:lipopolysaccharide transport system ATP-binding protein
VATLGFKKPEKDLPMSFDDVAIKVSNLSKIYEIYNAPSDRLKQFICSKLPYLGRSNGRKYSRSFEALTNISFEIKKGETVGIIGQNGAGKSTLLQIMCGTLSPSSGAVEISGRVAALLELGSGFNPEFTGRENVYLNAAVLGLSKEQVGSRFDDIVAFADIDAFIDQPVKTYSSGMYVRLAFAVIAHVDADILIIDEALAVGDIFFQQKCMRYLRGHQAKGGTVVFVSHDTSAVINLCDRAVFLQKNKAPVVGKTDEICRMYIKNLYADRSTGHDNKHEIILNTPAATGIGSDKKRERMDVAIFEGAAQTENIIRLGPFRPDAESFGNAGGKITDAWFEDAQESRLGAVHGGDQVVLSLNAVALKALRYAAFGIMIKDRLGQYIFTEGTDLAYRSNPISMEAGQSVLVKFSFLMPVLIQGDYSINIAFADGVGDEHIQHHWINDAIGLHSLKSRLVHGICGLQNLSMSIEVSTLNISESE